MQQSAQSQPAGDAFASLFKPTGSGRIRGLATAFGTKVLHVAGHRSRSQHDELLVYDISVWRALERLCEKPLTTPSPRKWVSSGAYANYCSWADREGAELSATLGREVNGVDVEYALFNIGTRS